jgi:sec-independent protein translocase protein TatC
VFISAATLTPPDVITQVLMAIPLILLYELGVILSKLAYRASLQKDA